MATRLGGLPGAVLAVAGCVAGPAVIAGSPPAAEITLLADDGWIMGGTANPLPDPGYLAQVSGLYLQPSAPAFAGQPTFPGFTFAGLTSPEQFCPFVCAPPLPPDQVPPGLPNPPVNPNDFPPNLTFGSSVPIDAGLLNLKVLSNADGANVVFAFSQSATAATVQMQDLAKNLPAGMDPAEQHYVFIGDPNSLTGGILTRFDFDDNGIEPFSLTPAPQHVPFVNIPLGIGPTPTGPFPTDIYTGEYDGWANFPQDPLNLLADLNALIGILTVHPFYPAYTLDQLAATIDVGTIGNTAFHYIPQNLPILQFMFNGGTAGQFFGDFFSPWARLLIDWGYGNAGDPGELLRPGDAGGAAVNGLFAIPGGTFIEGSPYQQDFGVAGGPWAATPYGQLYAGSLLTSADDSGLAGFFMKMDPLQQIAGVQNALIQSLIGPWVDVAAAGGPLSDSAQGIIDDITGGLRVLTGYDLVNGLDQLLLTGAADLGLQDVVNTLFTGPLISGEPVIDLVGFGFNIFNFFGA